MKKVLVVFLVVLGFVLGYWLAQENRKPFEPAAPVEGPQQEIQPGYVDIGRLAVGMETWQVRDAFGVPDQRNVMSATETLRKEEWVYGDTCLSFTNGVLISWEQR